MYRVEAVTENLKLPSPVSELKSPILTEKGIQLFVKRDDLIHKEISGNKWRKLYLNLLEAKKENKQTVLTFGGAFSNHIYATAAACDMLGLRSIGIIRGEYADPNNFTLDFARSKGMQIIPTRKDIYGSEKIDWQQKYPEAYIIPEGGNNEKGREGMRMLADEINQEFGQATCTIVLPIGTGCTMAGLINYLDDTFSVLGINVLRNLGVQDEIKKLTQDSKLNYTISNDYHFGGYAKTKPKQIDFANEFSKANHIILDPIYTSKMMYAIFDLIKKNTFPKGRKIVAIHTGGLQGIIPYNRLNKLKINVE